jgi:hypothetical protein
MGIRTLLGIRLEVIMELCDKELVHILSMLRDFVKG